MVEPEVPVTRLHGRGIIWAVVLTMAMAPGSVVAQDTAPSPDVTSAGQKSAKDMLDYTQATYDEMVAGVKQAEKLLETAQKSNDPDKADQIDCVRDKLASLRILRDTVKKTQERMTTSIANKLTAKAEYDFRQVAVMRSKFQEILGEAEQCLGRSGMAAATTQVDVSTQGVAEGDDTDLLSEVDVVGASVDDSPYQ